MKWNHALAIVVVIALGLPGIYVICLAAGVNPLDRLIHPGQMKETNDARQPFSQPPLPEPPESVRLKPFEMDRADGAKMRLYESKLSPGDMAERMQELMRDSGWEFDAAWSNELSKAIRNADVFVFRRPGWHCEIYIYASKNGATGSEVSVSLLPAPSSNQ